MRNSNEKRLNSVIYARLQNVQMSEADRQDAIAALLQAERVANLIVWVKQKFADVGHAFLKPSLRH